EPYSASPYVDGAGPALSAHRHSGADPRNPHRARRVALACEVVSEDHITRSKTARGAIANPDFHLPRENKNVLPPGRGVPIAPIVRRETAEHEVATRLKCNVVALVGRQREIFKMGLPVLARIDPYDHARAPSHRKIVVQRHTPRVIAARKPLHPCSARFRRNVKILHSRSAALEFQQSSLLLAEPGPAPGAQVVTP